MHITNEGPTPAELLEPYRALTPRELVGQRARDFDLATAMQNPEASLTELAEIIASTEDQIAVLLATGLTRHDPEVRSAAGCFRNRRRQHRQVLAAIAAQAGRRS